MKNQHQLRFLMCFLVMIFVSYTSYAQIIGGRGNGESTPTEVSPAGITAGGFSGDVSLFSGTFNSSYTLGSVSTPDGLSYTATLSYSSSYSTGNNQPHSSGIPYGEGWNLDIPSISVSNEDYNKFTRDQVNGINQSYTYQGANDVYTKHFYSNEAREEGKLHWFAPTVNIPRVASGRMIYKGMDGNQPVFVLHKFERYIEARLYGNRWEVTLDDGTLYYFGIIKANYRNASNQRVAESAINDPSTLTNLIVPKAEIMSWYVSEIKHPNKTGRIFFEYETFGAFNYFKEFNQWYLRQAINQYNNNNNIAIDGEDFALSYLNYGGNQLKMTIAYKDVILKEIRTGQYQKLVFNHESISTAGGEDLLDLWDASVGRKDSLYSYKTVKKWGLNGTGFDATGAKWKRYHHMRSGLVAGNSAGNTLPLMPSAQNPYVGSAHPTLQNSSNLNKNFVLDEEISNPSYAAFNHSYIESPRIGGTNDYLPAGDIYELKTSIYNGNSNNGQSGFINFDINVTT